MGRPIVQISLKDFDVRKKEIAADLWKAATEIGFFYLKDHELTAVRLSRSIRAPTLGLRRQNLPIRNVVNLRTNVATEPFQPRAAG